MERWQGIRYTLVKSENIQNKWFLWGLFFLIFISVGITYYRYVVQLDYFVLLQVSCDPTVESCFFYECDPKAEDTECFEDPAEEAHYYKKIEKKAYALKTCVENLEGCVEATCKEGEENCIEIQCDISLEESGGVCYGPGLILEEEIKGEGEEVELGGGEEEVGESGSGDESDLNSENKEVQVDLEGGGREINTEREYPVIQE